MESEYVACSAAAQEVVFLKRFFQSLWVTSLADEVVKMYCDSLAALAHAKDPKYHSKSKHIQTRYNYIRLAITQGEVILQHISISRMMADPLTKAIARDAFQAHVRSLGLVGFDMFLDTLWTFMFIHTLCNNDVFHFDSFYDVIDIAY